MPAPLTPSGSQRPSPSEFSDSRALKDVYFDFDRYDIRSDASTTLLANAAWLKQHPGSSVLIEGHCDERGTTEYNLALGQRRAQAARDFLMAQGVAGSRFTVISYGKERPTCSEATESCWARNRRAHFLVKPS
jgi:peptidoglycan-associated lipoprotein